MAAKPFDVAIIGGGITGLTLAIGLLKHGVPVTIYEAAANFGEIGAGVGFGPNAVRALGLVSPAVREGFERCATNQQDNKRDIWFSIRVGDQRKAGEDGVVKQQGDKKYKIGDIIFEVQFSDSSDWGSVHRAHFLDELIKLIPESVAKFGKRLADISQEDGSDDAVLHFTDGTTAKHSVILGCDGIKSRTRELLLKDDRVKAVFTGKYVYRGLIPMEKALEILGEEQAANSQMYLGYHGHVLTYPIEKGKTLNVVAFSSKDTWTESEWVVHASKEKLREDYRSWGPQISALVSAMEKPDIWALFNHPPAPTYYGTQPRICLVGDAAHATTPHQGSGAGMCIEDCYILSNLIAEAKSLGDVDRAFKAYDEVRRPRTQKLVTTSKEAGMLYEFELEGDDLEAIERNMTTRMKWIWDIDTVAELEKAKAVYRSLA
ncbi:mannitol 1-phosphate dehydrogenase [Biscogniauxia sp. FL1348]|nr:mannitol 1-phosphate dehydrogenase [Biscogniauxia sp. FL1348]